MTRECHVRFCERLRGKFLRATRQFFLGFAGYSSKAPFDPSMMVHFRKRFSQEELNRINELIAERGKAMLIDAVTSVPDADDSDDSDDDSGNQLSIDDFVKPADWPEGKPWGTLTIDASCTPSDITYPTDLKLLNEVRQSTERIIDNLCDQCSDLRKLRPRYDRGKARANFLSVAKQKKPRRRRIKAAIRRQLTADPIWCTWSSATLQRHLDAGPAVINAIVYEEIAFALQRIEEIDQLLPAHLYDYRSIPREAAFLAARAHAAYRERGGQRQMILPDFLIGAHALVERLPLLTRDQRRYRQAFPGLSLICPT